MGHPTHERRGSRTGRRRTRSAATFAAAALTAIAAPPARATDRFWGNQFGGLFDEPINWQVAVAGSGDVARFGLTTNPAIAQRAYVVTFTTDRTNQAIKVEDDFVTFALGGHLYNTTLATGNEIGNVAGRAGRLTLTGGTMTTAFSSDLSIGAVANSSGMLEVSTGGLLIGSPFLLVGRAGSGTLLLHNGGDLIADQTQVGNLAGATGTATVSGAGSALVTNVINVGHAGTGTLNLNGGGQVESNTATIGNLTGSVGMAFVDGTNSRWSNAGALTVGNNDDGTLNVTGGGVVQSGSGVVAALGGGTVLVDGAGSRWTSSGPLTVGNIGIARMDVRNGGRVESNGLTILAAEAPANANVRVQDANSTLAGFTELRVGDDGTAFLTVVLGGRAQGGTAVVGADTSGDGILTVGDAGSALNLTGDLTVGQLGNGSMTVGSGAAVTNANGFIGRSGGTGTVQVQSANTSWVNAGELQIGRSGQGTLRVVGGMVQNTNGILGFDPGASGTALVTNPNTRWVNTGELRVGVGVASNARVDVTFGGQLQSTNAVLGLAQGSAGTVNLDGVNSRWTNAGNLTVGDSGGGFLNVTGGARLDTSGTATIGRLPISGASNGGVVVVRGPGSAWTTGQLFVGASTFGSLSVENGGAVTATNANVGAVQQGATPGTGVATVDGGGAAWNVTGNLFVGGNGAGLVGQGTLNVNAGGVVTVGGSFGLQRDGALLLNGGELNVNTLALTGNPTFTFTGGTLRFTGAAGVTVDSGLLDQVLGADHTLGPLRHLAVTNVATLRTPVVVDGGTFSAGQLVNPSLLSVTRGTLNLTDQAVTIQPGGIFGATLDVAADQTFNVTLGTTNRSLVTGDGRIGGPFNNAAGGELRAEPGRSLTLTGAGNTNAGQVNLFGGLLEFTQDLTNNAGALISGNGTLKVGGGGLTNRGVMNFSGAASVSGDVTNTAGARVISSGGGPLTFFDDVVNDGDVRTSPGSFSVFFGSLSGGGTFTGTGTVLLEGDLKPGNSPAAVRFDGDLVLGPAATLTLELAGPVAGAQYDQLFVAGTGALDGTLELALLDGYVPVPGTRFTFFNGDWTGQFADVQLPDLGYARGWDTSALYSSGVISVVPEPSGVWLLGLGLFARLARRRRFDLAFVTVPAGRR